MDLKMNVSLGERESRFCNDDDDDDVLITDNWVG